MEGDRAATPRRASGWSRAPGARGALPANRRPRGEVETCRAIADRCAFVLGPARSGTTILAQMINAHDRAFMTTEANFHRVGDDRDFRDWYNAQHRTFGNQVCKSTYAPNFGLPGRDSWWEWLGRAAEHFDVVGDKVAFTGQHFEGYEYHDLQAFLERRFFVSRYIFTFRDPVQNLLGCAALGVTDAWSMIRAWGNVVKLWADMIRIFPATMTVLLEDLDAAKVDEIGAFLRLDLTASARLLDPREQRRHQAQDVAWGEAVERVSPLLRMIYGEIRDTIRMDHILLQADQKRDRLDESQRVPGSSSAEVAVVSNPVGRAWNLADELVSMPQGDTTEPNPPAPPSDP